MNKKGQIWVETVIYTLVALAIIGLVLTFVKPEINKVRDKAIIEQSLGVVKDIDAIILEITQGGAGNKRGIEIGIKKGILKIDGENDKISFEIDSEYTYSEPGQNVLYGDTIVRTEKTGKNNKIIITNNYAGIYDLTYKGENQTEPLNKASTPYQMFITNKGGSVIDLEIS